MAYEERGSREMFKATCTECKAECEVPFKPKEDRPIYCKECFDKRKEGGR
ncbi:MAG: CxxC-x17-CxxC domain-containing protein [Candidatus Omnitrophota bacterium]|jgi:CxxC-x17-CxxC domain-containing protein